MPTDLPPDYQPKPVNDPNDPRDPNTPGSTPAYPPTPGEDSPGEPIGIPQPGPGVGVPGPGPGRHRSPWLERATDHAWRNPG